MNYKDLVVQVGGSASDSCLDVAFALAGAFDARLTALCLVGEPFGPLIELPPATLYRERMEAEADRLLAEAAARARRAGVPLATRRETATFERLPELLARQARHADLAIIGQPDPNDPEDRGAPLAEAAFLASGRPALLVPYVGARPMPPSRVLAAWDGSREATRALHDALPLLARAERVSLTVVDPDRLAGQVGEQPGADIAAHLARHGVKVEVATVPGGGLSAADVLLARAADEGTDLLVMGGYGHARLREVVLGGTTRQILRQMTVPVLVSH